MKCQQTLITLMIYLQDKHWHKYMPQLIHHGIDISECCTSEVSESTYHRLRLIKHPELKHKTNEMIGLRNSRFISVDAESLKIDRYFGINNILN